MQPAQAQPERLTHGALRTTSTFSAERAKCDDDAHLLVVQVDAAVRRVVERARLVEIVRALVNGGVGVGRSDGRRHRRAVDLAPKQPRSCLVADAKRQTTLVDAHQRVGERVARMSGAEAAARTATDKVIELGESLRALGQLTDARSSTSAAGEP